MKMSYCSINQIFRRENNLSLTEYVFCDLVYFLSLNKNNPFFGWCSESKSDLAEEFGMSRQSIHKLINKMVDEDFLELEETKGFLRTTKKWDAVYLEKDRNYSNKRLQGVNKVDTQSVNKVDKKCKQSLHDTYIKENKELKNIYVADQQKMELGKDPKKKSIFRNSIWMEQKETFKKKLREKKDFEFVDLDWYYESVFNWSEQKGTSILRDANGWLATARNFIMRDSEAGKLKLNQEQKELQKKGEDDLYWQYLKMGEDERNSY